MAVVLALGLSLRGMGLLNLPSVGLDEARLALNVASRSYAQLTAPLDYDQSAPLLFLWIEKLATDLFGVNDIALRVVPLLASVGALLLVYPVSRRVVSHDGAVLVTALVACSPVLVYYAIGVKQYGIEVLVTLLLVHWSLDYVERGHRASRWKLLVGGAVAVWVSAPAVFVLAAAAIAISWSAIRSDERRRFAVVASLVWMVSFAIAYSMTYGRAGRNVYLQHYWRPALLTADAGPILERVGEMIKEAIWGFVIGYPGTPGWSHAPGVIAGMSVAVVGALAIGVWWLARQRGGMVAVVVAAPLAFAVGASLLGLYPIVLRLLLFGLPLAQILIVAAVQSLTERVRASSATLIWRGLATVTIVPLLGVSVLEVTSVNPPEHLRPLVRDLANRRHPGEPVYVFAGSVPLWAFYSTDWGVPDRDRLTFLARIAGAGGVAFENAPSRERRVQLDGSGAVYRTALGLEVYGVPTGIEWRPIGGVNKRTPDAGWAQHEAARARAVAAPSVWVVMSHVVGAEMELLAELESRGGRCTYVRRGNDSYLARYTFAVTEPQVAVAAGRRPAVSPSAC